MTSNPLTQPANKLDKTADSPPELEFPTISQTIDKQYPIIVSTFVLAGSFFPSGSANSCSFLHLAAGWKERIGQDRVVAIYRKGAG